MNRRRILQTRLIVLLIGLFLISAGTALGQYSGGDGSAENPWQISNKADLLALAANTEHYDANFVMTADVNLSGEVYTTALIAPDMSSGTDSFSGWSFRGVFDGNGFKITGLRIDGGGYGDYLGLFGKVDEGEVRNLGVEDINIIGSDYVGGLVGMNDDSNILNCYSTGSVSGDRYNVGGLVGRNNNGSISDCCSTGDVSGYRYVGGLVGWNYKGSISNCYSMGNVNGGYYIGGLVGWNNEGSISDCYSSGNVNGFEDHAGGLVGQNGPYSSILNCYSSGNVNGLGDYVGGLAGWSVLYSSITNSSSSGSVSGNGRVGGLVGQNDESSISKCYSTGDVNGIGRNVGGLVGTNQDGSISDSYSTGDVSGYHDVGGLVGSHSDLCVPTDIIIIWNCYSTGSVSGEGYGFGGLVGSSDGSVGGEYCFWDVETSGKLYSAGGIGKTTAQMKMLSTFTEAEWDFVNVWGIGENQTYPYLRQYSAGDINQDSRVDYLDLAELANNWLGGI